MEGVARHLAAQAKAKDGDEFDKFARSAFNRFYYSCFLIARSLIKEFLPEVGDPKHKEVPAIIKSKLTKRFKDNSDKAVSNHAISIGEAKRSESTMRNSAKALSQILEEGYNVRKLADYKPEVKSERKNNKIMLGFTSIETAENWVSNVHINCKTIRSQWKRIGG